MPLTSREEDLLRLLEQYVGHLRRMQALNPAELEPFGLEDSAVQRWLQLAIQCCIDLGDSMAPRLGIAEPPRMRDVFQGLARARIIDPSLVRDLERLTDFRNRLAHADSSLSPLDTWNELQHGLDALDAFSLAILRQREAR